MGKLKGNIYTYVNPQYSLPAHPFSAAWVPDLKADTDASYFEEIEDTTLSYFFGYVPLIIPPLLY